MLRMTECNCTCSLEQEYQLNVQACALSMCMLSIHSPDYVFTVLVSIFHETHNHFWAPSQCYQYVFTAMYSKSDGVLYFRYSHMRIANDTYHVRRTNVPTPPALYVLCISKASVCPRPHRLKVEGERMGGYKITLLHFSALIYRWDLAWGYTISHLYVWVGFSVGYTISCLYNII